MCVSAHVFKCTYFCVCTCETRGFPYCSPCYPLRQGFSDDPQASQLALRISYVHLLSSGITGMLPLPPSNYVGAGIWTLVLMFVKQVLGHFLSLFVYFTFVSTALFPIFAVREWTLIMRILNRVTRVLCMWAHKVHTNPDVTSCSFPKSYNSMAFCHLWKHCSLSFLLVPVDREVF